jgi:hypothetical protein
VRFTPKGVGPTHLSLRRRRFEGGGRIGDTLGARKRQRDVFREALALETRRQVQAAEEEKAQARGIGLGGGG